MLLSLHIFHYNSVVFYSIPSHHPATPTTLSTPLSFTSIQVASGSPKFFLGTDSAPHPVGSKHAACGCAGVFTAHAALALYAEAFASVCELGSIVLSLVSVPRRLQIEYVHSSNLEYTSLSLSSSSTLFFGFICSCFHSFVSFPLLRYHNTHAHIPRWALSTNLKAFARSTAPTSTTSPRHHHHKKEKEEKEAAARKWF
jgi:hypothetical protein